MIAISDYAAFIFDMDGLVLDTEPGYFEAWRLALETMGHEADPEFFRSFSGYRFAHIQKKLLEIFGANFDVSYFKTLSSQHWRKHIETNGIPVKPGVSDLLDYAGAIGFPVGIATNSPALNAHCCLSLAGIKHRFPLIVTGDDVQNAKPEPDIFLRTAAELEVDIRRCIVFEDSPAGIAAAVAAGAYSVYVPSIYPADPLTAEICDFMASNLSQVFQSLPACNTMGI